MPQLICKHQRGKISGGSVRPPVITAKREERRDEKREERREEESVKQDRKKLFSAWNRFQSN